MPTSCSLPAAPALYPPDSRHHTASEQRRRYNRGDTDTHHRGDTTVWKTTVQCCSNTYLDTGPLSTHCTQTSQATEHTLHPDTSQATLCVPLTCTAYILCHGKCVHARTYILLYTILRTIYYCILRMYVHAVHMYVDIYVCTNSTS